MEDAFVIGGMGTVGKATRKALDIPYFYDKKKSNITLEEGAKKLFCFFCLPTPTDGRGQQKGIDEVRGFIQQLKEYGGRNIFVIRSTVIPGTAKALAKQFGVMVASNPELLSEDTWERDAEKPRIIMIGADDIPTRNALVSLWKPVRSKIRVVTDTITAETLKYVFNSFFVTKNVFANQIYDVCQNNGANYKTIREALHEHPWGSKHHFKTPHKGGRGAGGKCLPKDVQAFAKYANLELLKTVVKLNKKYLMESRKE